MPTPRSTELKTEPLKSQPRTARRERRNWKFRSFFTVSDRRGPMRYWPLGLVIACVLAIAFGTWHMLHQAVVAPAVPYSEMAAEISSHNVATLHVENAGAQLTATLRSPYVVDGHKVQSIVATVPTRSVSLSDLERWSASGAKVQVIEGSGSGGAEVALRLVAILAVLGVVGFVVVRQRIGRGVTARRFMATPPSRQLTLADVGGAREAQADLRDVISYLRNPARFEHVGAKCPKGVLLIGPPGTGKTLLARAVAGEAGCPVITAAGSDFNEMYVGVGSRRVRDLARQAREQAPCIVFIDEFDSLGGRRGRPNRSGEEEITLNQLLVELDGMAGNEGVIWMAATNREDMLDPAVRRPGRFDRVVEVGLPTVNDRLEILKIHASRSPLGPDVDLERLAQLTVGHSGADLANLLNEAAIIAVQDDSEIITNAHIDQARDKILLGRVRAGVVVTDDERRLIALHEAGHAVVGMITCPEDKLHKVTIEPRGRTLGAAHFAPESDRHLQPRRYLEGIVAKALGGRAAETVFLGPDAVTTGAGSDLIQATSVARRMVGEFGMSDEVGLISADPVAQGGAPSGQLQGEIDKAVRALITAQSQRAESIVREHRDAVEALATALLDHDVLAADEVYGIAERYGVRGAGCGKRDAGTTRDAGSGMREAVEA
ncbi:MAG TPA: AAA family ATPase [Gemmatimonadaceae bacterium]|nr:AAA family ATPase [Gemmatimonadaceae bacterium]